MKNIVCIFALIVISLFASISVKALCHGTYKTSLTWQVGGIVYSHSETQIPFCSQIYYTNPAVESTFVEGATVLATGFNEGNAANYTEAKVDMGYYTPANGQTYCTYGNHYLISYYQVYVDYWGGGYYWYDPWQLGFSGTSGGYEGPGLFGFGNSSYWESSVLYIGTTSACATYTGQTQCPVGQQFTPTGITCNSNPTPTPTPTPPPPTISLESVGFKGDWKVKRIEGVEGSNTIDPNDTEPTWLKYSSDEPEPVAYTKGTTSTAFANFTLTNASPTYSNATIRVKEGNVIYATIPNVNVNSNGTFSINDIPLNNLPYSNKVGSNNYFFTWEISFDGTNWADIGTSFQKIHWLYAYNGPPSFESDPSGIFPLTPYSGIYDKGLENSTGIIGTNEVNSQNEIASIATILTQHVASLTYNPSQPSNADNPLKVFLDSGTKDVQCSTHVAVLIALLRTVGISEGKMKYYYGGGNNTRLNYYHAPETGFSESMQVKRDPTDGIQRDPHFKYHVTVLLGEKYYDPSYGIVKTTDDIYTAINDAGVCKYGIEANLLKITKTPLEYDTVSFFQFPVTCGTGDVDNASFVAQSLQNEMQKQQSYTVSITMVNTGLSSWKSSDGYQLGFYSPPNNSPWGTNTIPLPNDVIPGQAVTFSFIVTAPPTEGIYDFQWRMRQNGTWFGATSTNMSVEVTGQTECNIGDQQMCYWQGGYWNSQTCTCEGVY